MQEIFYGDFTGISRTFTGFLRAFTGILRAFYRHSRLFWPEFILNANEDAANNFARGHCAGRLGEIYIVLYFFDVYKSYGFFRILYKKNIDLDKKNINFA